MAKQRDAWTSFQRFQLYSIGILLLICAIASMRNEVLAEYGTDIFASAEIEPTVGDLTLSPTDRMN